MEDYVVNLIVSGIVFWSTLFLIVRSLLHKRTFSFCNRIVSTIHACVAVSLATLSVQDWSCPICPLASASSPIQMKTLAVTLSYLIYDMVCCLFDNKVSVDNLVHHAVSIIGIGAGLAHRQCGTEMVATVWITEISSPFLHARELLKELGYKDTGLNLCFDILFALVFSVARMVVGPYLTYVTLTANNPPLIKAMALGLQLVSAFWFYKILRMVRYKLNRSMSPTKVAAK